MQIFTDTELAQDEKLAQAEIVRNGEGDTAPSKFRDWYVDEEPETFS